MIVLILIVAIVLIRKMKKWKVTLNVLLPGTEPAPEPLPEQ